MKYLLLIPTLFFIVSCGDSHQKPHIIGKIDTTPQQKFERTLLDVNTNSDIKLATIEAKNSIDLANIEKSRVLAVESIKKEIEERKLQLEEKKLKASQAVALQTQLFETKKLTQEKENSNNFSLIIIFLFLLSLATIIYFLRKRREDKLKMHEDTLRIKEKELQVKIAEKMLETLSSGNLTPNEEQRMLEIFEKSSQEFPKIGK